MKRRVVVTGVGLVSSLGHAYEGVLDALRAGRSGTRAVPEWSRHGLKSLVAGTIENGEARHAAGRIPKRLLPGMSEGARWASLAALDAVADAVVHEALLQDGRTGCLVGTAAGSVESVYHAARLYFDGQIRRVDPYLAFRCMTSSASAAVANLLGLTGRSYSIGSACATGTHNIGNAFELIRSGASDCMLAGGAEDVSELIALAFDALRLALSTRYNDAPERASRPYDAGRDGIVLSGGAGILVLEELESAVRRGARIRAEIAGFGASSDGYDLAEPEPEGRLAAECMRAALDDAGLRPEDVDYVNTHGTGTRDGDAAEVRALRKVFGEKIPRFSSTKSMTGHAMGAAGALEAIFCVGMLERGFLAPSINIERLDPDFEGLPVVRETVERPVSAILSNSFGFGGTNGVLALSRFHG